MNPPGAEPTLPGLNLPLGAAQAPAASPLAQARNPRLKTVDRSQTIFQMVDVERLIEPEHPARAIWEFVNRLDLGSFHAPIQSVEGSAGRPAWDPRVLVSLWVYALSRGISSARELSRRCCFEPAFQWLAALGEINHHTLADFRSVYDTELSELFVQVLGLLSAEGLLTMERVMHDGTKIKALASKGSFRKEQWLQQHMKAAREQVQALKDWQSEETAGQQAARQRAARERQEKVEQALEELKKLQDQRGTSEVRVSHTDPQARVMKQSDGGYAPAYNVQLSVDAANKVIVAATATQSGNDFGQLVPAMDEVTRNTGSTPDQVVADAGFTTRSNIKEMAARNIDFYGSVKDTGSVLTSAPEGFSSKAFVYDPQDNTYRCPVGTNLKHIKSRKKTGALEHTYAADSRACQACPFQQQCCGREDDKPRSLTRVEDPSEVVAFRNKMETNEARNVYRQRSEVAEFPNAWIKQKIGLRQFRLRGLLKVQTEVLWACLTYNIQQWIRLVWLKPGTFTAN